MKALIAVAIVVTAVPIVAASGQEGATTARQERRVCRWVDVTAASRIQRRRVCMTSLQWRVLRDTSVDDEMSALEVRSQRIGGYADGVTPAQKGALPR